MKTAKHTYGFRFATAADIPLLVALNDEAHCTKIYTASRLTEAAHAQRRETCHANLSNLFQENAFHALIAYDKKKNAVGYAGYFDVDEKRVGWLEDLHTTVVNKGAGTALDAQVKKLLKKQKAVYMDVRATSASEPFYRKRDYVKVTGGHPHLMRYHFAE